MLRLTHNQTVSGAIRVDDIDDGLPNKSVHRLGSRGDPKAYRRDGYANSPKQPCYIPRTKIGDATIAGYIDVLETEKVILLAAPVITTATLNSPSAGDVTVVGTGLASVAPEVTTVRFAGTGVGSKTLTLAQITGAGGGSASDTGMVIKASLIAGLTTG